MKKIIIGLIGLIILLVGIFAYVKIEDNNSIDAFNIAVENHRAGTEQLLAENNALREQFDIYESRITEVEQHNSEIGRRLEKSEQYSAELEQQLASGITSSLDRTTELRNINSRIESRLEDSLLLIEELKENDFTE